MFSEAGLMIENLAKETQVHFPEQLEIRGGVMKKSF